MSDKVWPGLRLSTTPFALACLAVGMSQTLQVNVIGEAVLAEFLLIPLGAAALMRPEGRRVFGDSAFRWLLGALFLTLAGYVLSDLVRDSPPAQYLRGWGRIALVISGFVALAAIVSLKRQYFWWFCAGMAVGRVLYLRLVMSTPISMWKFGFDGFGYADPLTIAAAAGAVYLKPRLAAAIMVVLAVLSLRWDFRIQSLVCMLLAGFLWMRAGRPARPLKAGAGQLKLVIMLAAVSLAIYAGLKISEDDYSAYRRNESNVGRSVGRIFALKAIAESPLVGYGSWSRSRNFARLHAEALREVAGRDAVRYRVDGGSSATHSMILQSWVEGGLIATAFFFVLGILLIRGVITIGLHRPMDGMAPLLMYFAVYGLWHITMSPFAAPLRVHLALAAVTVVYLALERRQQGLGVRRPARAPMANPPHVAGALTRVVEPPGQRF